MGSSDRCYYEVLGVGRSATPGEVREAYKTKALQLHPDKNRHRLEEATQEFTYLQQSYTVLSDPHERKWYDNHREAILRQSKPFSTDGGRMGGDDEDECESYFDLMPLFNPGAFHGFTDGPKGFFTVYREVFEDIEAEEQRMSERQNWYGDSQTSGVAGAGKGPRKKQPDKYPLTSFGYANTCYLPTLQEFYKKWTSFQTRKNFYGVDKYTMQAGYNRDQRRYLEKENKRLRDAKRKEYNDTVKSLALFVKKRDPRYLNWKKQEELAQKEKKLTGNKSKREKPDLGESIPKWAHVDEADYLAYLKAFQETDSETDIEGNGLHVDESDATEIEARTDRVTDKQKIDGPEKKTTSKNVQIDYYCEACKKSFKSESQWNNHEKSKKHIKEIRHLQRKFKKEEQLLSKTKIQDEETELEDGQSGDELYKSEADSMDGYQETELESEIFTENEFDSLGDENLSEVEDTLSDNVESVSDDQMDIAQSLDKMDLRGSKKETLDEEPTSDIDLETLLGMKEQFQKSRMMTNNDGESGQKGPKKKRRAGKTTAIGEKETFKCKICRLNFETRNSLFKHIHLSKHAAFK